RVALPADFAPMQAETAERVLDGAEWMWEPKLDGYRALAFIDAKGVRLRSRKGLELAADYPRVAAELAKQGAPMVLDGELVAFDADGKPSFNAMQNARQAHVVYYVFDLLHFAGADLRTAPYSDRRRYLAQ